MTTAREETVRLITTMVAPKEVRVDAAIASVMSELESIYSLNEQRTALKVFHIGIDVCVHPFS